MLVGRAQELILTKCFFFLICWNWNYFAELKLFCKRTTYPSFDRHILTLTLCHCNPADAPTRPSTIHVSLEVKLDSVGRADDCVGRQGGAAPLLHQGRSVAIPDCQVVVAPCGREINVECSEFQCHDQFLIHFYYVGPLNIVWVVVGIIWRSEHACNKKRVRIALSSPLTLRATAVIRTKRGWCYLPESNTSGWVVRNTRDSEVLITTAATIELFINILTVKSSRELSAGLARCGRDWGGADWAWAICTEWMKDNFLIKATSWRRYYRLENFNGRK